MSPVFAGGGVDPPCGPCRHENFPVAVPVGHSNPYAAFWTAGGPASLGVPVEASVGGDHPNEIDCTRWLGFMPSVSADLSVTVEGVQGDLFGAGQTT